MSDPKELDALVPGEAKRQREALRRKIDRGGPYIDFSCSRFNLVVLVRSIYFPPLSYQGCSLVWLRSSRQREHPRKSQYLGYMYRLLFG